MENQHSLSSPTTRQPSLASSREPSSKPGARARASRSRDDSGQALEVFKFQTKMQQLIQEATQPLGREQMRQLETLQHMMEEQAMLSRQINEAASATTRSEATLRGFLGLDKELAQLRELQEVQRERHETQTSGILGGLAEQALAMKAAETNLRSVEQMAKRAAQGKGVSLADVSAIVARYQGECSKSIHSFTQQLGEEMDLLRQSNLTLGAENSAVCHKYDQVDQALRTTRHALHKVQADMLVLQDQNDTLKDTYKFGARITNAENENRGLRALIQQSIISLNESIKNALCQREVEETCLKLNFDMLDAIFGEDQLQHGKDNLQIESQIKLNVINWQQRIRDVFELGNLVHDPENYKVDSRSLATPGSLRKKFLMAKLNQRLIKNAQKVDDWGKRRCCSLDNMHGGENVKPQKRIECLDYIDKEFIVERLEGYKPRYLRVSTREVSFDLPGASAGQDDELPRTPSSVGEDSAELSEEDKSLTEDERLKKALEKEKKGREQARKKAATKEEQIIRERARERKEETGKRQNRLKADQNARKEQAGECEIYRGQMLPKDATVMTKRVNVRRQNSNHGRKNAVLVTGPAFKPLFVPFKEFISNTKQEMIKADAEDMAASLKAGSERKQQQDTGDDEEVEDGGGGPGTAKNTFAEKAKEQRGARTVQKLREKMEQIQNFAQMYQPKRKGPREEVDPNLITWGKQRATRDPVAPRGMQFVNIDNIADLNDLELFKQTYTFELSNKLDDRFNEFDTRMSEQLQEQSLELKDYVKRQSTTLSRAQKKTLDSIQAQLIEQEQAKLKQIMKFKEYIEQENVKIRKEVGLRFYEQAAFNEEVDRRLKLMVKKIVVNAANFEVALKNLEGVNDKIKEKAQEMEGEFHKILDVIVSMIESLFLGNLLDLQAEVDKHSTSLWAVTETQSKEDHIREAIGDGQKKQPTESGTILKLDEDCLSCTLEKYRPMIKEAFKMACIQYKPTQIPFRGSNYIRRELIDLKDHVLSATWDQAITSINYYQEQFGSKYGQKDAFREAFLTKLDLKLKREITLLVDDTKRIDELVIDRALQEHIQKNASNMGFMYQSANELEKLDNFKQSVFDQISTGNKNKKSGIYQSYQQLKNQKMIDRKTQSVIERLKDQTAKKRRESKGELERGDSTLEQEDGMGHQELVHKLTEDLKDLAVRSRAVIPTHRTQLTSPRAKKAQSLAKHEFVTPKMEQEPKSKLEKEQLTLKQSTKRNEIEARELAQPSKANTGSKQNDKDLFMYIQSVVPALNTHKSNSQFNSYGKKRSISVNVQAGSSEGNFYSVPVATCQQEDISKLKQTQNQFDTRDEQEFAEEDPSSQQYTGRQAQKQQHSTTDGDKDHEATQNQSTISQNIINQTSLPNIKIHSTNNEKAQQRERQAPFASKKGGPANSRTGHNESPSDPQVVIKRRKPNKDKFQPISFNQQVPVDSSALSHPNISSRNSPPHEVISNSMSVSGLIQSQTVQNTDFLKQVIQKFDNTQKTKLLAQVKNHNVISKRLDNQAVIKGSTKHLNFRSQDLTNNERPIESTLEVLSSNRHKRNNVSYVQGNGYLYSHGLIENLRAPFQNPYKSPLNGTLESLYDNKTQSINQMSEILAMIKLQDKQGVPGTLRQSPSNASCPDISSEPHLKKLRELNNSKPDQLQSNYSSKTLKRSQHNQTFLDLEASVASSIDPSAGVLRIQDSNNKNGLHEISSFRQDMKMLEQVQARQHGSHDAQPRETDQEFYFPSSSPSEIAAQRQKVHQKFDLKYEPSKFTEELNDSRTGTSYLEKMTNRDGSQADDNVNVDMGTHYKEYHKSFTRAQKSLIELHLSREPAPSTAPMAGELEMDGSVLTHPLNPSCKLEEDAGASEAPRQLASSYAGSRPHLGEDRSRKCFKIRNDSKDSGDGSQRRATSKSRTSSKAPKGLHELTGFDPGYGDVASSPPQMISQMRNNKEQGSIKIQRKRASLTSNIISSQDVEAVGASTMYAPGVETLTSPSVRKRDEGGPSQ